MVETFPKSQDGLRGYILRKERRDRLRNLAVYVPFFPIVSLLTPLWVLAFIGVAAEIYLFLGVVFWLVEACLYFWGPEGLAGQVFNLWTIWAAASYSLGLIVCLLRAARMLFPWEMPAAHAILPDDAPEPDAMLRHPVDYRPAWKRSDDGSFWMANVAVEIAEDGYYAFEAVAENPAAPLSVHVMAHPSLYRFETGRVELRSISRITGRLTAGEFRVFLFMPGGDSAPEVTLTQIP